MFKPIPYRFDPNQHRIVGTTEYIHHLEREYPKEIPPGRCFLYQHMRWGTWVIALWCEGPGGGRWMGDLCNLGDTKQPTFTRDHAKEIERRLRPRPGEVLDAGGHAKLQRDANNAADREHIGEVDEMLHAQAHLSRRLEKRGVLLGHAWGPALDYRRKLSGRGKRLLTIR